MKRTGPIAAEIVADIRFHRKIAQIHDRGPRAVAEVFAELGAEHSIMSIIDQILDRHLAVSDQALEIVGGNRLTPIPLHAAVSDDVPPSPEAA